LEQNAEWREIYLALDVQEKKVRVI
jgi:hypothetical protein